MSNIQFLLNDISKIDLNRVAARNYINQLIVEEGKKAGDISYIFCSDNYLLKMNQEYLNHDYFTDIITFDYCEGETISGDIFISIDRVKENADDFNEPLKKELFRVIFHGILHLAGYRDKTDIEKSQMKAKEDFYLRMFLSQE